MKDIHSTLLKSMPAVAKPKRSRIPGRILLIIFISAFILVPALIIITRALPKDGIGYIFYWIHDYIYLPIKGYTYTLFYPFSLSWWGPVLTALFLWVVAYLTMVSFIKNPHVYILRKVILRTGKKRHRILIKTGGWLKKGKMEPLLLQQVTNLERKKNLNQLSALPLSNIDESMIRQVIHLTQLHIGLITLPPVEALREIHLEALLYWHRAYLQVNIRCQKNPHSPQLKELVNGLAEQIETLILPLLNYKKENLLKGVLKQRTGFDIPSILIDLLHLASLNNSRLAVLLLDSPTSVPFETVKKVVLTRIASSTRERQIILDETRRHLEKLQKQKPGPYNTSIKETFEAITHDNIHLRLKDDSNFPATILPLTVELSLTIALHLAALVDNVSIGMGYIDSLETYDFVFNSLDVEESPDEPESSYFTSLKSLNRLPGPEDFRLCAHLAQLELDEYENQWKESILKDDGTISPNEIQLARKRVQSLFHAAGPE